MAQYLISGIAKEGSVISITLDGKTTPIKVDCRTGQITSYTGREVKYFPATATTRGAELNTGEKWAVAVIRDWVKVTYNTSAFAQLELFIANLDLIETTYDLPDECPKGYIKWLRDNEKTISRQTLHEFESIGKMEQLTKEDREVYDKMSEHWRAESPIMRWYVSEENKELRKKFNQILKTSAKGFDWCLYNSLDAWYSSFIRNNLGVNAFGENWVEHLDGNRDFRYNIKTFEYARDKERNDKILANEAKIKAIEQLSNEEFVIIVPSDIEQFTQEGQMQNNCVGSYYHDSMARGRDLIYFIRHTATPNRSYITNRYNIWDRQTVESRTKNNDCNNDSKARELIRRIDEKIRELLSAEQ
jgi:hypothetical protein